MSGRNFGKSYSSFTYSDTVNGENGRRYETGARTHESPIREARQIISRHHQVFIIFEEYIIKIQFSKEDQ